MAGDGTDVPFVEDSMVVRVANHDEWGVVEVEYLFYAGVASHPLDDVWPSRVGIQCSEGIYDPAGDLHRAFLVESHGGRAEGEGDEQNQCGRNAADLQFVRDWMFHLENAPETKNGVGDGGFAVGITENG
jgi:hypothetical protein